MDVVYGLTVRILDKCEPHIPDWVTPNLLSWLRLAAVPCMWGAYLLGSLSFALFFYAVGCVTDLLDGYLARKRGLCSDYGKRLDEMSDKGFVFGTLALLFGDGIIPFALESWVFWVVIGIIVREIAITGLRDYWPEKAKQIPSLPMAKMKTLVLMIGLGLLILADKAPFYYQAGIVCLVAAFVLAVLSGCQYAFLFARR